MTDEIRSVQGETPMEFAWNGTGYVVSRLERQSKNPPSSVLSS
jgi:hypothetical protein